MEHLLNQFMLKIKHEVNNSSVNLHILFIKNKTYTDSEDKTIHRTLDP